MPARPPITQASRQLRQESLPLFYKTCTFSLGFANGWRSYDATPPTDLLYSSAKFLENTTSKFLKLIQRLEISGLNMNGHYFLRLSRKQGGKWFIEDSGARTAGSTAGTRDLALTVQEQSCKSILQILEAMEARNAFGIKSVQAFMTMLRSSE